MRIGVGLPNQVHEMDPAVIPDWARRAEAAGFSSVGTLGRISYPGLMDTVALAAAAAATRTVELFSTIMITPVWPPVLLAKELAGIDALSGGRLTVGVGLGGRPDDYVADGYPPHGLGRRLDADLDTYHRVWRGEPTPGSTHPAVPTATRPVPLLFGGTVPATFTRMAHWGTGYTTGGVPAPMLAQAFETARTTWRTAGREGTPRLVAMAYFALGNPAESRRNVTTYYGSYTPDPMLKLILDTISTSPADLRETIKSFAAIGTDDLILHPTTADPTELTRLAEVVLS
ncbi:LLM class flavin-dependent oxidoreductase [Actinoplanes sp. RD1]|uniref:LLM class flavin-dependent oxidoreductase n=1 Tax=Actinoplanes sp. RD1 TaxID=3064538 RepID=UPI00274101B6|nr:LLM class flavin-dependent oxidoreductase [Actinoplanes sp. RD1]